MLLAIHAHVLVDRVELTCSLHTAGQPINQTGAQLIDISKARALSYQSASSYISIPGSPIALISLALAEIDHLLLAGRTGVGGHWMQNVVVNVTNLYRNGQYHKFLITTYSFIYGSVLLTFLAIWVNLQQNFLAA